MNADEDLHRHWLAQTAGGDRLAFEQLYRSYHRRVFGFVFRMVDDAETAELVTSDVMLEVWKGAGRFKGESKVSTWIFGIARFKALNSLRRKDVEAVDLDEAREREAPGDLPDEALIRGSLKLTIKQALTKLSREHREVIELTFYEGFSYPEIAKMLDCPVNTVKTRMFHARKRLRDLLSEEKVS